MAGSERRRRWSMSAMVSAHQRCSYARPRREGRGGAAERPRRVVWRGVPAWAPRAGGWVRRPAPPVLATVDIEHPINYSAICRVGRARRRAGAPRAGRGACLGGCTSTRRVRRRETVRVYFAISLAFLLAINARAYANPRCITAMHTRSKLKLSAAECAGIEPGNPRSAHLPAAAALHDRNTHSATVCAPLSPRAPHHDLLAIRATEPAPRACARELLLNRAPASPGGYAADAGTD